MSTDLGEIRRIIVKSVLDKLTNEEKEILDNWCESSPRNQSFYRQVVAKTNVKQRYESYRHVDVEAAFRENQKRLRGKHTRHFRWRMLPYAAVVFVMIGLGYYLSLPEPTDMDEVPVMLSAGTKQAVLILADGKSIKLQEGMEMKIMEGNSNIHIFDNRVNYQPEEKNQGIQEYNTVRVPLGGEYQLVLSDSTEVWLNAMSELRFPVVFQGDLREVYLSGEAFFKVKRDEARPFVVRTEWFDTRVLGTSFNVCAYREASLSHVTLCSGVVRVNDARQPEHVFELVPGEQMVYKQEDQSMDIHRVDPSIYMAWTTGFFQFENSTLEEVFDILQRWYRVKVIYQNDGVRGELFTGKFRRFDNMQIILDLLERVSDLEIEVKENVIWINK